MQMETGLKTTVEVVPESGGEWQRSSLTSSTAVHGVIRMLCLLTSAAALSVMMTAEQAGILSFYGFSVPLYSKWSLSDSFRYLVGVSVAVAAYSLLQLLIIATRAIKKPPVSPRRSHCWLLFAFDQIFVLVMVSAGSAASGVTSLNRTGIRHSVLPNFCKPLSVFCGRVAVSISFAFLSGFLLAVSVVLDVISLSLD